jgi:hypothetical protein
VSANACVFVFGHKRDARGRYSNGLYVLLNCECVDNENEGKKESGIVREGLFNAVYVYLLSRVRWIIN